ncbi:hypothetical protein ACH5RR_025936 [Cinchona calisaya]|uniref:Uncharacterized protein n=1 Tax=Cinchona calisaya TaxID=153742 RepID=A0ABD2Z3C4_9GENT
MASMVMTRVQPFEGGNRKGNLGGATNFQMNANNKANQVHPRSYPRRQQHQIGQNKNNPLAQDKQIRVVGVINTIVGRPATGDTSNVRKKYATYVPLSEDQDKKAKTF